jgi:hypothetical protein
MHVATPALQSPVVLRTLSPRFLGLLEKEAVEIPPSFPPFILRVFSVPDFFFPISLPYLLLAISFPFPQTLQRSKTNESRTGFETIIDIVLD